MISTLYQKVYPRLNTVHTKMCVVPTKLSKLGVLGDLLTETVQFYSNDEVN